MTQQNPYQSPQQSNHKIGSSESPKILTSFAEICCIFGLILFASGLVITFLPGSEVSYFCMTGTLIAPGLLSRFRALKIVACIAIACCLFCVLMSGFHRKELQIRSLENVKNKVPI